MDSEPLNTMAYADLLKILTPVFSHYDVADTLGIKPDSAEVLCSRYVKKGLLTRLKRGFYSRTETLSNMDQLNLLRIANILQVPSYISLMTALSYYGIIVQKQTGIFESISLHRTIRFEAGGLSFRYIKLRPELYGDFLKKDGICIALPEKAILDSLYLTSIGRYMIDGFSLDLAKIDKRVLSDLSGLYPAKARRYFEKITDELAPKTPRHEE